MRFIATAKELANSQNKLVLRVVRTVTQRNFVVGYVLGGEKLDGYIWMNKLHLVIALCDRASGYLFTNIGVCSGSGAVHGKCTYYLGIANKDNTHDRITYEKQFGEPMDATSFKQIQEFNLDEFLYGNGYIKKKTY
jgi:hypothetical protein